MLDFDKKDELIKFLTWYNKQNGIASSEQRAKDWVSDYEDSFYSLDTVRFNLMQSVDIMFADLKVALESEKLNKTVIAKTQVKLKKYLDTWYKEQVLGNQNLKRG